MNDSEIWLKDWHARYPGATARAFARAQPSTYEWLAARAGAGDRVLDLACGDGFLLELLLARGAARAVGLDMSDGELSAARARLGDRVELVQARAQELPFPDASFDCVTCHLGLMLMLPVEPVIAEVHRVLRPGGRFAAVVGGGRRPRDDAWSALMKACAGLPLTGPQIGDRKTSADETLRDLLAAFEDVRIEPIAAGLPGTPDEVWDLFVHTYTYAMIPADQLPAFEASQRAGLQSMLRPDGTVPCTLDLLAVEAARNGRDNTGEMGDALPFVAP